MFSGKTDALIRLFREVGGAPVAFKPERDDRHPADVIVSHSGLHVPAIAVAAVGTIERETRSQSTAFIDEIQFFPDELADVVRRLRASGTDVIAAGLDYDFRLDPFRTTSRLIAAATRLERLVARCSRCGEPATLTQRLINGEPAPLTGPQIVVGDRDLYEPRCPRCWHEERAIAAHGGAVRGPS